MPKLLKFIFPIVIIIVCQTIIIYSIDPKFKTILLAAVYLVTLSLFYLNIVYLFQQYRIVDPLSFIKGQVGRDEYIERYRPEYATIQFANKRLPEDAKILGIFLGKRGYYSDRLMIFDSGLFKNSVQQAVSPEHLTSILKENKFTHLLIRYDLFNRWSESQFNDREKAIIRKFFVNHASRLFGKAGHGLFEL